MKKFDVYWVDFDPAIGSEIHKIRPAVIISPSDVNKKINTVVILPMTTKKHNWSTRVPLLFDGKEGEVAIDQIRAIDKQRLVKKLGTIEDTDIQDKITEILMEFFS